MLRYERLFQKPALFTRITGIKFEKFEILVMKSKNLWNEAERKRLCSRPRKRAIGGGRNYGKRIECITKKSKRIRKIIILSLNKPQKTTKK